MYDFLSDNNLSPNQSGFRSGDSCINQLYSINHEISNALDKGHKVRVIFLDILKSLDKVWHDGMASSQLKINSTFEWSALILG